MLSRILKSDYNAAVAQTAGIFSLKIFAVHMLTIRARLMRSDFTTETAKDDKWWHVSLLPLKMLLCHGPLGHKADFFERLGKNCAENESFFLVLALALGATSANKPGKILGAEAASWVHLFCGLRLLHSALMIADISIGRSLTWGLSSFTKVALALGTLL